tara:strand:+ start:9098 stop:9913 length:816 start_codon:yes stop_codon:yes gene_type:complete
MSEEKIPKKRGRKPKGGKIIKNVNIITDKVDVKKNIILHLKCFKTDININGYDSIVHDVEPFVEDTNFQEFNYIETKEKLNTDNDFNEKTNEKVNFDINNKLNELEKDLNNNNITKKSDCFWCTCGFDTPIIFIPTYIKNNKYQVYGNFCSPECACSYLFNEHIDDSIKYERYQLLNFLYGKIYNYNKNIKLAPSPFYILDKYYGNLSINEYRQLLLYDRLLIITNKPLTKFYPELHQDNVDFEPIYNNKISMRKKVSVDKNKKIKDVFHM